MYSIKNDWETIGTFTTITESDLVDVTDDLIQMGTDEQKYRLLMSLPLPRAGTYGWRIQGKR